MGPLQSPFPTLTLSVALLGACGEPPQPSNRSIELLATPAAVDSLAPELVATPDGGALMSWLEADRAGYALRFARYAAGAWSDPATIATSDDWFVNYADRPSVVPLDENIWAAHWLARRGDYGYAYDIEVAISTDAGRSWSAPVVPHRDATETQHGFLRMYRSGSDVGLLWLDGRKYANEVSDDITATAMTLRAATLRRDQSLTSEALVDDMICDCCEIDVAETSDGPVAVYRDRSVDEIRDIYLTRRVGDTWQPGRAVHTDGWEIDGCPVNGPVVEASGRDVAVAWFTGAENRARVQVAWSTDAGTTFGAPIEAGTERALGHVGAELLPDGDLVVSWLRTAATGGTELCLRRITPAGALGPVQVIVQATDVFAFSVPQILLQQDALLLAWTRDRDDHFTVATATVPVALLY
jgi:hypothetical protein